MVAPILAALTVAYLLGAVPFSFLIGKWVHGVDIRTCGSGNVGATNLGRSCGWRSGVAGLVLDVAKGWAAVLAGAQMAPASFPLAGDGRWALLVLGGCAVAGHMWPVFLCGHGGGKGVAAGAGVFLAIDPVALGLAAAVFVATLLASSIVSLSSVLAAALLPVILYWRTAAATDPVFLLSIPISLAIVWKHRTNLVRLRAGTESRLPIWRRGRSGARAADGEGGGGPA